MPATTSTRGRRRGPIPSARRATVAEARESEGCDAAEAVFAASSAGRRREASNGRRTAIARAAGRPTAPHTAPTPRLRNAASLLARNERHASRSSPGFFRSFCARCGSVAPGDAASGVRVVPLGGLDGDPGVRPEAHIFVASRAPWFELSDSLPRFDAYPPGIGRARACRTAPRATPRGSIRGSCLCGGVGFVAHEPPALARFCHCSRCRKARAAAFAAISSCRSHGVRFTRGASQLVLVQDSRARCASRRASAASAAESCRASTPSGSSRSCRWARSTTTPASARESTSSSASKAAWDEITDGSTQHAEMPG